MKKHLSLATTVYIFRQAKYPNLSPANSDTLSASIDPQTLPFTQPDASAPQDPPRAADKGCTWAITEQRSSSLTERLHLFPTGVLEQTGDKSLWDFPS